ncbi:hypothetical protein ISN44_As02g009310 [Arabidopsis suecica]|uniref:DUF1204 domain-containing protein n=1 Tax=Arabidopsis suecica TaxID=45249 RepID=A0A8T2GCA3_ARASU|nr:hypothetical protein ISN44_As02g009310 [Arabidopsis suecica]
MAAERTGELEFGLEEVVVPERAEEAPTVGIGPINREAVGELGGHIARHNGFGEGEIARNEFGPSCETVERSRGEFGVRFLAGELVDGGGDKLVGVAGENGIVGEELSVCSNGGELSGGDGEINGEREELGGEREEGLIGCEGEINVRRVDVAVRPSGETSRERPSGNVLEPSVHETRRERDKCGNNGQGELSKMGDPLQKDVLGASRFGGFDPMDDRDFGGFNDFGEEVSYVYDCENVDEDYISDPEGELGENGGLGRLMMENGFGNLVVSGRDTGARGAVGTRPVSRIEERRTGDCSAVREYCVRRNIAISQLTVGAIRNAIGLAILGAECGIEIDTDFFEEATTFSRVKESPGSYYASAKAKHKIVSGAVSKIHGWQRRYFFVKLSEFSVENLDTVFVDDWTMSPEPVFRVRDFPPGFLDNIARIRELGALHWPTGSFPETRQTRLRMGKIILQLPRFVDEFGENPDLMNGVEPSPVVTEARLDVENGGDESLGRGSATESATGDVVVDRSEKRLVAEDKGTDGDVVHRSALPSLGGSTPSKKRTSRDDAEKGSFKVPKTPRRETTVRGAVDHGFSYQYKAKDIAFTQYATACADLVSSIRGASDDFSSVDRSVEREFFKDWAQKTFDWSGKPVFSFLGCKAKVSATRLATESAEREASQKLAKELTVERERSATLEKRSATLEKRSSELFKQVSSIQSSLDETRMQLEALDKRFASEGARLRKSRIEHVAAERKKSDSVSRNWLRKRWLFPRRTLDNGVRQLEVADLLPGDLDPFEEVEAGAVGAQLGVVPETTGEDAGDVTPADH